MGQLRTRPLTRVAWVVYDGLDARTGGTIYDAIVVGGLRAVGVDVDVVAIARGTHASSAALHALEERVARADVIVGDELCFRELAALFPRIPQQRRVLLVHHLTCWEEERPASERAAARALEQAALERADVVIATSETTRRRLHAEHFAVAAEPAAAIDVLLPGSDRLVKLPRAERERITFLFVGAVIPRKRVRELVRALHLFELDADLRIAGSRTHDAPYAAEVEAIGEATFLDELDDASLARELAAADALVMPSSLEGYGMAATEAIAAGVPVIAARAPGLGEALAPAGEAALFVDSADDAPDAFVPALADALRRFATDDELRARMTRAAAGARMPRWSETIAAFRAVLSRGAR